jgi:FKBP-type peptidyl-prolyl cis-trans isomerase FkpA
MELLSFDDDDKKFNEKNYTSASILISANNEVIYERYKEDIIPPSFNNFNFLLFYLNEGDSAQFKVLSEKLNKEFKLLSLNETKNEYVDVKIKIHQFLNQQEFDTQYGKQDVELTEQIFLNKYLNKNTSDNYKSKRGIFVKEIRKGKGDKIEKGDIISINYKGYYINRIEFDNNYKESAFTFTYGTPGQVIKGLEIAINGMKEGEKSKIIIPSQLAFGEEGSSTHIVPPFTTVIYELEIVNVKQAMPEIIIEKLN